MNIKKALIYLKVLREEANEDGMLHEPVSTHYFIERFEAILEELREE